VKLPAFEFGHALVGVGERFRFGLDFDGDPSLVSLRYLDLAAKVFDFDAVCRVSPGDESLLRERRSDSAPRKIDCVYARFVFPLRALR